MPAANHAVAAVAAAPTPAAPASVPATLPAVGARAAAPSARPSRYPKAPPTPSAATATSPSSAATAVDVHRSCRLVGQARRLEVRFEVQLCHPVRRHCEVHLGRAPGALVAHEATVQWVVDVVGLGHVKNEVGGRAEPVEAGEEELSAGGQVVGAHNVPRVRQGQGVAVHTYSRGVRDRSLRRQQGPGGPPLS